MPSLATSSAVLPSQSSALTDVTGAERSPRTLILCFDGTSSQFDGDNTNVVKFYALLRKDNDFDQQLCYYQPGIGTYFNPGVVSPIFQWCAQILDEAFAWYLDEHVRGGYQFLMQNYVVGDKICIFGFSRGAYTARALAGMLHKIGLLPRDNPEQVPFAYKLYKQTDDESIALAAGFKQTFCRNVKIEFVGVWETVTSVGVIMGRSLPFTTSNTTIKTFRHAIALDEHRVKFLPNLYHRPAPGEENSTKAARTQEQSEKARLKTHSISPARAKGKTFMRRWLSSRRNAAIIPPTSSHDQEDLEAGRNTEDSSGLSSSISSSPIHRQDDEIQGGTDVLEVWFAGCHSDVGGGVVPDDTKLSLSDITLRWMVREVVLAQCGIEFDQAALVRAHIPESIFKGTDMPLPANATAIPEMRSEGDVVMSAKLDPAQLDSNGASSPDPSSSLSSGSDPLNVDVNALQPLHDQLKANPLWWLLEIIPLSYTYQDANGEWQKKWWIHLGRGRDIPDAKPKFHVSVQQRMQDPDLKYTPRAKWTAGTETYVQ